MSWLYLLVALAGTALALQAPINAQLARWLEHPVRSSMVSFTVGALSLLVLTLFLGRWPGLNKLQEAPPVVWVGGLLGAFYVTVIIFATPRIGTTATFALVIAGQLSASILLAERGPEDEPSVGTAGKGEQGLAPHEDAGVAVDGELDAQVEVDPEVYPAAREQRAKPSPHIWADPPQIPVELTQIRLEEEVPPQQKAHVVTEEDIPVELRHQVALQVGLEAQTQRRGRNRNPKLKGPLSERARSNERQQGYQKPDSLHDSFLLISW